MVVHPMILSYLKRKLKLYINHVVISLAFLPGNAEMKTNVGGNNRSHTFPIVISLEVFKMMTLLLKDLET